MTLIQILTAPFRWIGRGFMVLLRCLGIGESEQERAARENEAYGYAQAALEEKVQNAMRVLEGDEQEQVLVNLYLLVSMHIAAFSVPGGRAKEEIQAKINVYTENPLVMTLYQSIVNECLIKKDWLAGVKKDDIPLLFLELKHKLLVALASRAQHGYLAKLFLGTVANKEHSTVVDEMLRSQDVRIFGPLEEAVELLVVEQEPPPPAEEEKLQEQQPSEAEKQTSRRLEIMREARLKRLNRDAEPLKRQNIDEAGGTTVTPKKKVSGS